MRFYGSRRLSLKRGYMQYVWDIKGNQYIDANTGHGVGFLGHSNPEIVEAIKKQVASLATLGLSFHCNIEDTVLDSLQKISPESLESIVFLNTGAEAVETALKMAWAYTGRRKVIAFKNSFHGRTLGALSVTWNPRYRKGFPVLEDVVFAPYNSDEDTLSQFIDKETGAVIVEPAQGEGGVIPGSSRFLESVGKLAHENEAVFIIDEIQSGFGRTGRIWNYSKANVDPDILLAGKCIGGGFPVSIVFARNDIAESLKGGRHGSTFAGNPVAMAAVDASIRVLEKDNVPSKAEENGRKLLQSLQRTLSGNSTVRDIRGEGLMIGIDLRYRPEPLLKCLQEKRVIAIKAGSTVLRLLPPFMITSQDIGWITNAVKECISIIYGK
jgi:acetylornithine/LysW-gamma-L-lysine aminotransferase